MEKKKNNAVEKTENVVNKNQKSRKNKSAKKSSAKKAKSSQNEKRLARKKALEEKKKIRLEKINQKKEEREKLKAEREKIQAQKRIELAKIRAHKKAEKQKAKATLLREKNRKRAEREKRLQEIKAERKAHREMLKNEDAKDRRKRLAEERKAKLQERKEKRELKHQKHARILEEKRAKREQKRRDRQKNKDRRKGFGGWLAAVISLGVVSLVLASVLTFTFLMPTAEDNMLESAYQKSFYSTVEQIDNIDLNLSKVLASKDKGAIQKYLVDTAINSELAENDLQQLPLHDESKHYTTKLINQIGDYAKYLNNKLISGESLSKQDYEGLNQLYRANQTLKNSFQEMNDKMGEDYSFSSMLEEKSKNLVTESFDELQNLSVQFPELIYDGPFSDGMLKREIKNLNGQEITEETARQKFNEIFSNYKVKDVKSVGSVNDQMESFNVEGNIDGEKLYAQISKKGGELLMFAYSGSCNAVYCDGDDATEVAQNFLTELGHKNMKPVWINLANNVYTINFAYEENGVIVYSDLIKVRVCAETKMVIGLEATSYFMNHTERNIEKPTLTKNQAQKYLLSEMEVNSIRLALVPIGTSAEKLCYEFAGEFDGSTYYVYIDAKSGRQVEMFKVIESTEGTLLM